MEGIKGLFLAVCARGPLLGIALKRMFVIPTACCGKFIGSLHQVLGLLESFKPEGASGKIYLFFVSTGDAVLQHTYLRHLIHRELPYLPYFFR